MRRRISGTGTSAAVLHGPRQLMLAAILLCVALARGAIAIVGLLDVAAAVALILASPWFYSNVGEFPPYNRHYAGDAGVFLLGIGAGLLVAAWDPRRYLPLLLIGIGVSWLHALNHLYDAIANPGLGQAGVLDTLQIVAPALVLTVAAIPFVRADAGRRAAA